MLTTQAIQIAIGQSTREGRLVLSRNALVAVLSQVLPEDNPEGGAGWSLELGLGILQVSVSPLFGDVDTATAWIADQLR